MRCTAQLLISLLLFINTGSSVSASPTSHIEARLVVSDLRLIPPKSHVALGGDVHISTEDLNPLADLRYRLRREEDDATVTIRTALLQTNAEDHFSIPCGYFSRGGVYIIDVVQNEDYNDLNETIDEGSVVNSWRFEVKWPSAKLSVTPEYIQTYPERPVSAILEFPDVTCSPLDKSSADFWLELLYCGHASGGAVLCDGRNISSHAHVLSSEQIRAFAGRKTVNLRCELFGQAGDYALILRPAISSQPSDYTTAFIKADWSEEFVLNVHGDSVFPCHSAIKTLFQYPACVLDGADRVRVFGREGSKLRYVAERRVKRGQHSATFDCGLFRERFPEYCFVYVSQAVTGAVADVRMDCIPTLPLSDHSAGTWGPWTAWSACPPPEKCSAASKSRHRFCNQPPSQYSGRYCEGRAVEIASCECRAAMWREADTPAVVAEVGVGCRCGCTLHLGSVKRLVAASTAACPAHSFWLLKAEPGKSVRLLVQRVVLPCPGQRLQARAGETLASPLIAGWTGAEVDTLEHPEGEPQSDQAIEVIGGRFILLDLRSDETNNDACQGGFIAHAMQIDAPSNITIGRVVAVRATFRWWSSWVGGGRGAAVALAVVAFLVALALALHSRAKHHRYQRASDKDQLTDSDACTASLEQCGGSKTTLFSAVSSPRLKRLLPQSRAHERLRESIHANEDDTAETASLATLTPPQENAEEATEKGHDGTATLKAGTEIHSEIRIEIGNKTEISKSAPATPTPPAVTPAASPLKRARTCPSRNSERSEKETEIVSPEPLTTDLSASTSSVSERECNWSDREIASSSEKDRNSRYYSSSSAVSSRATSAATLTNGRYSPTRASIRTARVRDSSNKHYKERNNKRRALRASDLSLNPEMEMDYYDYEVDNAGLVPGSYLGMDPAFLVWIPPIEDGDDDVLDNTRVRDLDIEKDLLPRELYPDPGSNKESPEESNCKKYVADEKQTESPEYSKIVERYNVIHPLNFSSSDLAKNSPNISRRNSNRSKKSNESPIPMKDLSFARNDSPLKQFRRNESPMKPFKQNKSQIMDLGDIKFADENSDSSGEMKYADEIDSNKLADRYEMKS